MKINPYAMLPKSEDGKTILPKLGAADIVGKDDIAVMWIKKTDQIQVFVKETHKVIEFREDGQTKDAINGVIVELSGGQKIMVGFLTLED